MTGELTQLTPGQPIIYGGNRVTYVPDELAASFTAGDRLVVVHETGELLHVPRADHDTVSAAVDAAASAFAALVDVGDDQITAFFGTFADRLADDALFDAIAAANAADVADAAGRGRPTGRLELTASMRVAMIGGLRTWRDAPTRRAQHVATIRHVGWSVEAWRDPLGVVGFVFEGRPNVFADATGVLRTGNTAVFRIGSDALRTARAMMAAAVVPALGLCGLPAGAVQLVDAPARAAGWALFADARLSLAVARGSGPAVAQLGAVARQHGVPASLHGTGGAWLVADDAADADAFAAAVRNSLDRKVCNTLNVCCIVAQRAGELLPVFHDAVRRAAETRDVLAIVHELAVDDPRI
ncbi:MAG: aldehyde dehydrogenase family protein, partial [Ilumatobacteraceae bacterium]